MRLNVDMAGMARRAAASLIAALTALILAAAPALAGDRALADFIGFSPDGKFFAFEEFGVGDGSGFPYATIYVIDVGADEWVTGTPIRVVLEDETATLQQARDAAMKQAADTLTQFEITEPADVIALNGDGEVSDGLTLDFAMPGYFPGETIDPYKLSLEVFDANMSDECISYMAEPGKGFALTITGKDGVPHELHRDKTPLPKSRGCITTYRLFAVVTPQYAVPQDNGVAIISIYPIGFEGPDRRFLAVPTLY